MFKPDELKVYHDMFIKHCEIRNFDFAKFGNALLNDKDKYDFLMTMQGIPYLVNLENVPANSPLISIFKPKHAQLTLGRNVFFSVEHQSDIEYLSINSDLEQVRNMHGVDCLRYILKRTFPVDLVERNLALVMYLQKFKKENSRLVDEYTAKTPGIVYWDCLNSGEFINNQQVRIPAESSYIKKIKAIAKNIPAALKFGSGMRIGFKITEDKLFTSELTAHEKMKYTRWISLIHDIFDKPAQEIEDITFPLLPDAFC